MRPIDGDKLYAVLDHIANEFFEMKSEPQGTMGQTIQYVMGIVMDQPDIIQPPNDPLTLEQLREMDGEPVWIEFTDGYKYYNGWALVQVWAKSTNIIYLIRNNGSVLHPQVEIDCGGKIYRRKPEEGSYGTDGPF